MSQNIYEIITTSSYQQVSGAIDKGGKIVIIYTDFLKTFDRINTYCTYNPLGSPFVGVTHGSSRGLLAFIFFINDLPFRLILISTVCR